MKTITQFVQVKTSKDIESYVEKKLKKIYDKYNWVIKAQVFFKKENNPNSKDKICSIELSAPGPKIFALAKEYSYEIAVKEVINDLLIQLKKRKAIISPHA